MADNTDLFRIIIVGGGIAGFTAAIALRGLRRQITVLEQSSLNKEIGALISLQQNASRIMETVYNLKEDLKQARGMVDEGFKVYSKDGKEVKFIPLLSKKEYGASRVVYHRQDLHAALKRAACSLERPGDPVKIRLGTRVVDCDSERGKVVLENGETLQGDLIVAADGIHSVLRKHVLGEENIALPTGLSAYRLLIPTSTLEEHEKEFCKKIDPRAPYTSMIVAHESRLIMGPGRQGEVYAIVGLCPDEKMNEDPKKHTSWVSEGKLRKMLETFSDFPSWVTDIFKHSPDLGLWQLRDLDPLKTWHRGRVILIGDAAHAMLPTQGQGASQAVEDAEALGAFFEKITGPPTNKEIMKILEVNFYDNFLKFVKVDIEIQEVFQCRYHRASLIQGYSRQAAKSGTPSKDSNIVQMSPDQFMDYNCNYPGAIEWRRKQLEAVS
ncbi:hypothetical protein PISL3812_09070 [Talaromyces islandicus]|uniref:FAD-binding domain-containing protein n=1 Tax=Talaromyces islandicus TaxID=28573 RepID=A0A0U1MAR6_TALIS|nr:hypothetical protein PISL3812_09070 [Talaromyces islandicus]